MVFVAASASPRARGRSAATTTSTWPTTTCAPTPTGRRNRSRTVVPVLGHGRHARRGRGRVPHRHRDRDVRRRRSGAGAPAADRRRQRLPVLTPLRTAAGPTLLVVRGFVPDSTATLRPADVPAPPSGEVTVTGRIEASRHAPTTSSLRWRNGQVESVNVGEAARRLGGDRLRRLRRAGVDPTRYRGPDGPARPRPVQPGGRRVRAGSTSPTSCSGTCSPRSRWPRPFVMVRVDRKRAASGRDRGGHPAGRRPRPGAALTAARHRGRAGATGRGRRGPEDDVRAYEDHVRATRPAGRPLRALNRRRWRSTRGSGRRRAGWSASTAVEPVPRVAGVAGTEALDEPHHSRRRSTRKVPRVAMPATSSKQPYAGDRRRAARSRPAAGTSKPYWSANTRCVGHRVDADGDDLHGVVANASSAVWMPVSSPEQMPVNASG